MFVPGRSAARTPPSAAARTPETGNDGYTDGDARSLQRSTRPPSLPSLASLGLLLSPLPAGNTPLAPSPPPLLPSPPQHPPPHPYFHRSVASPTSPSSAPHFPAYPLTTSATGLSIHRPVRPPVFLPWKVLSGFLSHLPNTRDLEESHPLRTIAKALADPMGHNLPAAYVRHPHILTLILSAPSTMASSTSSPSGSVSPASLPSPSLHTMYPPTEDQLRWDNQTGGYSPRDRGRPRGGEGGGGEQIRRLMLNDSPTARMDGLRLREEEESQGSSREGREEEDMRMELEQR